MSSSPTAPRRTALRLVKSGTVAAALVYAALLLVPRVAFAHALDHGTFRVYSAEPLGADSTALVALLDEVDRRLSASEVYDSTVVHRVYLTPNPRWFAVFAPGSGGAYAINRRLTHDIVVNASDVAANAVGDGRGGRRALDGVLAHELTHTLLARALGDLRLIRADIAGEGLRQEGYCDYVAGETSFDPERGADMLRRGERERSASFEYFRWSEAARHLVEAEGATVEHVVLGDWDVGDVLARAGLAPHPEPGRSTPLPRTP